LLVIPAKAGIQLLAPVFKRRAFSRRTYKGKCWIPAFAGMTS